MNWWNRLLGPRLLTRSIRRSFVSGRGCLGSTDALKQQVSYHLIECFFVTFVKLAALLEYLLDLETNYLER